ncbi:MULTISPECIES: hypothetical protein [unclassified Moorena]|uniref:hypothetical protein n=1 Tax=unclassified Moorena TaxID=2683338 RepID=UPI0014004B47|nr:MULTISPECIES: hypothetical protein [unclassified Moorena]NEO15956.1 hypothetical protein [Moorena sp. SIO3E8]NEP99783.1 hypothetical protein [Moorena sp. SIO3F7]
MIIIVRWAVIIPIPKLTIGMILTAHPTYFSIFPTPYSLLPTPYSLFPLLKVGSKNTNSKAYHRDDTYCPPYIFFHFSYSLLPTPYSLFPIPFAKGGQ